MSRAINGGVIGQLSIPTLDNAKGMWDINTHTLYKKNLSWPQPSLPGFTSSYQTLINDYTGPKYFINATTGNDSNNGTSQSTPWQTYTKFRTTVGATAAMVIFLEGTYALSSLAGGGDSAVCMVDQGGAKKIVCAPGRVKFTWNATSGGRDRPFFYFTSTGTVVYGGKFVRTTNVTEAYSAAFFTNSASINSFRGSCYNCAFEETTNYWAFGYANEGWTAGTTISQCTFRAPTNALADYSGSTAMTILNCAGRTLTTYSTVTNYYGGTPADQTYVVAGATNQGVYYGTYAWPPAA